MNERVGLIGTGLMGTPMAHRLIEAGIELCIFNRTREKAEAVTGDSALVAETPAALAARVDIIILMLADTQAVDSTLRGPGGVLETLAPGTLVIDMGTTAVADTRVFAEDINDAGGSFLDAPVSGGVVGAEQGSLSIMVGGDQASIDRAMDLFNALGSKVTRVGEVGAGQVAKAVNQVIVGLTISAVAEGLALAERAGADIDQVREALSGGFASSRVLELHGARMAKRDYKPGGRCSTQRKDLDQALELAGMVGIELPSTELCRSRYDALIKAQGGDLDHSALIELYRQV
ncbi:MAG: 2-hydroxy-3-oxopropionate reductase [marine bacterium B5-7]|nr:MAG: 2-hydroxy-3-oxopropionate reductase [marine bacterium B5-7]